MEDGIGMRISDRTKDYNVYRSVQVERSDAKWNARTFNEKLFFKTILTALPKMYITNTGKCLKPERSVFMGIRDGNEYFSFKRLQKTLTEIEGSHVYGVDINPKVTKVGPNCIACDFAKLPEEYSYKFDFLYSNSLDHSYEIEKTITEWHRILKNDRFMLLQLSSIGKTCKTEVYDFDEEDVPKLFDKRFEVRHVWKEYGQDDGSFNVLVRIIK